MGRAIWSAEADAMLSFPARFFVDFFERHGFLNIDNRPQWQAVKGGSREYVRKLIASMKADVRLSTRIDGVRRRPNEVESLHACAAKCIASITSSSRVIATRRSTC